MTGPPGRAPADPGVPLALRCLWVRRGRRPGLFNSRAQVGARGPRLGVRVHGAAAGPRESQGPLPALPTPCMRLRRHREPALCAAAAPLSRAGSSARPHPARTLPRRRPASSPNTRPIDPAALRRLHFRRERRAGADGVRPQHLGLSRFPQCRAPEVLLSGGRPGFRSVAFYWSRGGGRTGLFRGPGGVEMGAGAVGESVP